MSASSQIRERKCDSARFTAHQNKNPIKPAAISIKMYVSDAFAHSSIHQKDDIITINGSVKNINAPVLLAQNRTDTIFPIIAQRDEYMRRSEACVFELTKKSFENRIAICDTSTDISQKHASPKIYKRYFPHTFLKDSRFKFVNE